ncbi:hypothetical protein [Cutibacterium avidum]|uniref:hypothetical protein n=1 Tax=Cutibacterium avidum TaxID=33010 RepID=UPI000683DDCC|nr:hypothetical protein [Cutibacterium avidum]MCO6671936.1 hypothetical protein [Cutibacterium avidum]MDU5022997.1 hypothetical protein [Cutibacterium avidum]
MSIHHSRSANPDETPVSLPLAIITVDTYGVLTVSLDGADYPPPSPTAPWTKGRFGELLDVLTADRTRTIRVEIHEVDGSTFTDIIRAARTPHPDSTDESPAPRRARHRHAPETIEVTGAGFQPGEDVTIALVRSTAEATAAGTVRVTLNLGELPTDGAVVLLVGASSARVMTRRVP